MSFLSMLKQRWSRSEARKDTVFAIYNKLVEAARNPTLYKSFNIPDTLDSRFDSIVLHISLFVLATDQTVKTEENLKNLRQSVIEIFLKDMDRSLREIGVGDLSVGKQVKKMATAMYGRISAYEKALKELPSRKMLEAALKRNLYRSEDVQPVALKGLARYAEQSYKNLKKLTVGNIKAANLSKNIFKVE